MVRATLLWLGMGLALAPALSHATPHLPAGDEVIVETLPVRYDPALAALGDLRREVRLDPHALQPSLRLAQAYIEAARRNADPRFLGYAQATLAGWPDNAGTPHEVRLLRATVLQSLHQFDESLRNLDAVILSRPDYAQALLTRATVLQVTGRYTEAQKDCAALLRSAGEVVAQLCLASVASVTGRLDLADSLAARALRDMAATDSALLVWAYTLQAETAVRRGSLSAADHALTAALQIDADDPYARAAYCDVLLDMELPERVLELTRERTRDDNLLLRRALALQMLASRTSGQASWKRQLEDAVVELQQRHRAANLRGDRTHLREQARMTLSLERKVHEALRLAQENWSVQREPADARILLEAAAAAADKTTRDEVAAWMKRSGLVDAHLSALLRS
jgi:tetratricopeptide (TPR) repeat protein